jgi:hypothetical protein
MASVCVYWTRLSVAWIWWLSMYIGSIPVIVR